jgi:FAS-associated death domain protein
MDPFLVLLHSLSGSLSGNDLMELKFLCRERVSKRKLERVQSGLDLFTVLLEQNDLERGHTGLLRELLASLRRHDLLQRLDDFEAGTATAAPPGEAGGQGAGNGRGGLASVHPPLAPTGMDSRARPLFSTA